MRKFFLLLLFFSLPLAAQFNRGMTPQKSVAGSRVWLQNSLDSLFLSTNTVIFGTNQLSQSYIFHLQDSLNAHSGTIGGSGTSYKIPLFSSSLSLGNSQLSQNSGGGLVITNPQDTNTSFQPINFLIKQTNDNPYTLLIWNKTFTSDSTQGFYSVQDNSGTGSIGVEAGTGSSASFDTSGNIALNGNIEVTGTSTFDGYSNFTDVSMNNLLSGGSVSLNGIIAINGLLSLNSNTSGYKVHSTPSSVYTVYHAFGNSITYGTSASPITNAYPYLIANEIGATLINYGVTSSMIADVANNQIFKNENPSSTFSPLYTLEIGTNECDYKHSTLYESAVFKPIHQACLSWLAIPSNYKVFGQASTQSGTWVNDGNYQSGIGIVSATHNSTASFPITTGGGNIYIWYRVWDGGGGTFTYSLDGGTPVSVNAYLDTTIATNLSGTKSIALARISGVSADDHTLLITVTSPTNSSDSVGIWSIGTVPYLNYYRTPRVYSGGVLKQKSDGNEPWVSNYNADAEADVDTLSQDGLSVYFVDVQSYENYATDIPIDVHPNNLGHRHLADAFESVIQAIPGTNNMARQDTTFSNSALTLATLITTNVARDSASWNAKVNGADSNTVGNAHYATPTWIAGNYIATGYLSNLTNYLQVARKDSGVYLGGYISPTELDTKISGLSLGSMSKVDSATFKANLALTYAPIAYLNNLTNYLQFAKKDSNTTSNAVTLSYVKANYVATSVGTLASLANIGTSYAGNFYFGESGDSYLLNGVPNFWSTFAHFSLGDTCTTLYSNTALTNPQGAMLEAVNTSHTTGNFAGASYAAYNSGGTLQRAYIGVTSTASGYSPTIVIGARSASATFTEWANFSTTGALHLTTLPASGGSPLYASGGVVGLNSSDQRLKQNINPLTGNLAKVMSLSPSSFTMIADTANRVHTGFIAQAVSPIFPQAVYSYHNNGDTTTYYGIDYSAFAPILAGAIKEIDTTFQPKGNYQTANANLTSIASLSNSTGYLYNSGVGIFSYSIPAVPAYDSLKWNGTTNTVNRDSTVWNGKMDSTRVNTLRGQDTSRAIVREGLLAPLNAPALTGLASLGGNTFSATVGAGDTVQVSITGATANARYSAPADNGLSIDTVGYIFRKWTNGVTIKGKYKHVYDVGLLSK